MFDAKFSTRTELRPLPDLGVAKIVYDFLGTSDRIGIRHRPAGHIPNNDGLPDFADHLFFGKLPCSAERDTFTWSAPQ